MKVGRTLIESDVTHILSRIPHLTLAKQGSAKRYIELLVRDGVELETTLSQFPRVQYEPLDPHYVLLRSLGGLCEELVSDLCTHYTWRGIAWASFLVALAPDPRYKKYLAEARERAPLNKWLVELAMSEVDGTAWSEDMELQSQLHALRAVLSHAPLPTTSFRRAPSGQQLRQIKAERERVRAAYQSGGLEAAREEVHRSTVLRAWGIRK